MAKRLYKGRRESVMNNSWIITIGREYCSGGAETGHRVAEYFGIPYYDKKIVDEAADIAGMSSDTVKRHDEKPVSMFSFMAEVNSYPYSSYYYASDPELSYPVGMKIADAQFKLIRSYAKKGPCVIVGRCADYILRDQPNVLNVFIRADMGMRVERAMRLYGIEASDAKKLIKRTDKIRSSYYKYHTNQEWSDPANYNLIIDSGKMGTRAAAEVIERCIMAMDKDRAAI